MRWSIALLSFLLLSTTEVTSAEEVTSADLTAGRIAYESGDLTTARQIAVPLANQGNAAAQVLLALVNAPFSDTEDTGNWLRLAAIQGNATAQYLLADIIMRRQPERRFAAYFWLEVAQRSGLSPERRDAAVLKQANIRAALGGELDEADLSMAAAAWRSCPEQLQDFDANTVQQEDVSEVSRFVEYEIRDVPFCYSPVFSADDLNGDVSWVSYRITGRQSVGQLVRATIKHFPDSHTVQVLQGLNDSDSLIVAEDFAVVDRVEPRQDVLVCNYFVADGIISEVVFWFDTAPPGISRVRLRDRVPDHPMWHIRAARSTCPPLRPGRDFL